MQLNEGHDDLLPLFNNILQELILSTIIRILPILELSVVELFKDGLNIQQNLHEHPENSNVPATTNTLSRLFVSMHRIGESAKLPFKFQRHIICSLLSNFSLCLFETLLLNNSLLSAEIGKLLDEKIERLISWFGNNSEYGYIVRKYLTIGSSLAFLLINPHRAGEVSYCFTTKEINAIINKENLGGDNSPESIIGNRRNKLEKAMRKIPILNELDLPELNLVDCFGKKSTKKKLKAMSNFAGRSGSNSSLDKLGDQKSIESFSPKNVPRKNQQNMSKMQKNSGNGEGF